MPGRKYNHGLFSVVHGTVPSSLRFSRLSACSPVRNSPLSCCGRSARVSHIARGWIYKGVLRRRRHWCSRYSRTRLCMSSSSSSLVRAWIVRAYLVECMHGSFRLCACMCAGFPQQRLTEDYRPKTTPTADVANNGAINATGMWKSDDVLRADNGNARQLWKTWNGTSYTWTDVQWDFCHAEQQRGVLFSRRSLLLLPFIISFFALMTYGGFQHKEFSAI